MDRLEEIDERGVVELYNVKEENDELDPLSL